MTLFKDEALEAAAQPPSGSTSRGRCSIGS